MSFNNNNLLEQQKLEEASQRLAVLASKHERKPPPVFSSASSNQISVDEGREIILQSDEIPPSSDILNHSQKLLEQIKEALSSQKSKDGKNLDQDSRQSSFRCVAENLGALRRYKYMLQKEIHQLLERRKDAALKHVTFCQILERTSADLERQLQTARNDALRARALFSKYDRLPLGATPEDRVSEFRKLHQRAFDFQTMIAFAVDKLEEAKNKMVEQDS